MNALWMAGGTGDNATIEVGKLFAADQAK